MSFFLALPSDSSFSFFPDNKTSSYTTRLSKEFNLYEDYEIGLSSIHFPLTYFNVKKNELKIFKVIDDPSASDNFVEIECIPEGRYPPDTMVQEMFKRIDKSIVDVSVSNINRRVTLKIGDRSDISLNYDLSEFLGGKFTPERTDGIVFEKGKTYFGVNVIQYRRACHNLYIYCDLVEPRPVGDALVSLLSVVPNPTGGSFGDTVVQRFENIRYFPLGKRRFNTVKLDIVSDIGEKIPFEDGKVFIELHIRKVKKR